MDPEPSQSITKDLQDRWTWIPDWIDASVRGEAGRLVTFRSQIQLSCDPTSPILIRLTADTRYKLIINGKRAMVGPSRGSDKIWYYDTVDIAPFLRGGANTIVVKVLRFFPGVIAAVHFARTSLPGLTVLGTVNERVDDHIFYTGKNPNDVFLHVYEDVQTTSPGPWSKLKRHKFVGNYGILSPWRLASRMIPAPEETAAPFKAVRNAQSSMSVNDWNRYLQGSCIELPANSSHRIEVEFECHSTAFIRFVGDTQGPGASLKVTYSEGYEGPARGKARGKRLKGDRTKREGNVLKKTMRLFTSHSFRFLVLDVKAGSKPLQLSGFEAVQTNYPMGVTASWKETEGSESENMWDISVRTMRNCMFDGYSDCPFYEQLQYCEDARSAMLFHYCLSGDDRLAQQAITAFAASVQPDGLVSGRYPAHGTQIITGFALFWILQVCDHNLHFDDTTFLRPFLPIVHSVLDYFERHTASDSGLVCGLPEEYWSFIDWHEAWDGDEQFKDPGVPQSGRKTGTWSFFSMLYAYTLRQSVELLKNLGCTALVQDYAQRADRTVAAIKQHCFDGHFFTDSVVSDMTDSQPKYSALAQAWGVLCGSLEDAPLERSIMAAAFATDADVNKRFAKCSYPMTHYAFRALSKVGLYEERFDAMWAPWREMMAQNLTTWTEDDVSARSDCHEWSSLPIWEFATEVAGLKPLEPGWKVVEFAPRLGLSKGIEAKVNLGGKGLAKVSWTTAANGDINVYLELPEAIKVVSRLPGTRPKDEETVTSLHLMVKGQE